MRLRRRQPDVFLSKVTEIFELELGREYRLVLTKSAGLYRYDISDIVRVESFEGEAPVIAFLNKGQHIASITGEKISELQVVTAFHEAIGKATPPVFVVCPSWGDPPRYSVLLEEADVEAFGGWPERLDVLDRGLRKLNIEYNE